MSTTDPTKRILGEFGEPEEFFGFALADLKLLIPTLFAGMIVVGNTPASLRVFGWGIAGGMSIGMVLLIYASPRHLSTERWLKARLEYLLQPSVITLLPDRDAGNIVYSEGLHPEVDDRRDTVNRGAIKQAAEALPNGSGTARTQDLANFDHFHVGHGAGEREDGYVFGAVQVHPANMALATMADWEHAVNRLGSVVNGIEFPFQIYSTVTPVDPERITQGYRERLEDRTTDLNPAFRTLLRTYREKLPHEFARRGTSIREYYVIVCVSALDVHRDRNSVNETGILATLEDLSYVGGFVTTLRTSRRDVSPEELEAKQVAELDHRLTTVEEEFAGLDDCTTTRISTPELAALLKDFWEADSRADDDPLPSVSTTPVVRSDVADVVDTSSSSGGGAE
jgi:hypothetical protein